MTYSSSDAALYSGLRARLTNVIAPDSFHAQIGLPNHLEDFDKFSGHLNEWANNCVERPTCFPEMGNYTLVKTNNSDHRWNRAVVTKELDNGVSVCLIDLGIERDISDLDEVCGGFPPKLLSKAQQALHCCLVDIHTKANWSESDLAMFRVLVSDIQELQCTVYPQIGDKWPVALYHRIGGVWKSVGSSLGELGAVKVISLAEVETQLQKMNFTETSSLPKHILDNDRSTVASSISSARVANDTNSVCTQASASSCEDLDNKSDLSNAATNLGENDIDQLPDTSSKILPSNDSAKATLIMPSVESPVQQQTLPSSVGGRDRFESTSSPDSDGSDDDNEWDDTLLDQSRKVTTVTENGVDCPNTAEIDSKAEVKSVMDNVNEVFDEVPFESISQHRGSYNDSRGGYRPRGSYRDAHLPFRGHPNIGNYKYGKKPWKPYPQNPLWRDDGDSGRGRGRGYTRGKPFHSQVPFNERRPFVPVNHNPLPSFANDSGSSQMNDNKRPREQLGGDALKNEVDWLEFKIESEIKKFLPSLADTKLFVNSVSVILNGSVAQKLSDISSIVKPLEVVLSVMFKWYMQSVAASSIEAFTKAVYYLCGMCKREFSTVFFEVCDKLFKENCENYTGNDAAERQLTFCSLLEKLYSRGIAMESCSLVDVVVECLEIFFTDWTMKMSGQKAGGCLVNYRVHVHCICTICSSLGVKLDERNRDTLEKYFQNLIPRIITDNILDQTLKLDLLDLIRKRDQWLRHISERRCRNEDGLVNNAQQSKRVEPSNPTTNHNPPTCPVPPSDATPLRLDNNAFKHTTSVPGAFATTKPGSQFSSAGPLNRTNSLPATSSYGAVNPTQVTSNEPTIMSGTTFLTNPSETVSSFVANTVSNKPNSLDQGNAAETSQYHKVSLMLHQLGLSDLINSFKTAMIQDSLLSSEKQELKDVLKDAHIPPGAILSIMKYLTSKDPAGQQGNPTTPNDSINLPQLIEHDRPNTSSFFTNSNPNSFPVPSPMQSEGAGGRKGHVDGSQSLPPSQWSLFTDTYGTPSDESGLSNNVGGRSAVVFGRPMCALCGSSDHRGYSCPKREDLLFGPTQD